MTWLSVASVVLTAALGAWLFTIIVTAVLRVFGAKWARLPKIDRLIQWLMLAAMVLPIAQHFNWYDPADRAFLLGWAILSIAVIALWIYGRLNPPAPIEHRAPRVPPKDAIQTGIFRGWSPRAVRSSLLSLVLFVVAGSLSGELIVHGYPVLGGVSAAIACLALPLVFVTCIMLFFMRSNREEDLRPGPDAIR